MAPPRKASTTPAPLRYEKRRLTDLIPDPDNPRKIDKKSKKRLGSSIKRFGLVQPIVVNERDGGLHVVGGHQRMNEMIAAGEAEAMVVIGSWSRAEERALNVTLNNPGNQGAFSEGLASYIESVSAGLNALDFITLGIDGLLPSDEKGRSYQEAMSEAEDVDVSDLNGARFSLTVTASLDDQPAILAAVRKALHDYDAEIHVGLGAAPNARR